MLLYNMNLQLFTLAIIFIICDASFLDQWQQFKHKYDKTYKSILEEKKRQQIFEDNLHILEVHNRKYQNGDVTWKMAINKFSDMTDPEFKDNLKLTPFYPHHNREQLHSASGIIADDVTVNYVDQGLVTPVKEQGVCGACWAFSAVGAIEGQIAKHTGRLESLSAQILVDCCGIDGSCWGGNQQSAMQWVADNGIETDAEYPYTSGGDGQENVCWGHNATVRIAGYKVIPKRDENALLDALLKAGPISVGMDATNLRSYADGIITEKFDCTEFIHNHAVLIVGAGMENGIPFYLVKNSWGKDWGLKGYFKVKRGRNVCGISNSAAFPYL